MRKLVLIASALTAAVAFNTHEAVSADMDAATKTDNTRQNKQEQPTADQQRENSTDRKITQKIRRNIMKNKSLSLYAHNVKVITRNGKVTLKGPVKTEAEKNLVEQTAVQVVGKENVTNELEVAPSK